MTRHRASRLAAVGGLALVLACGGGSETPGPAPTNVLLLLVDTLRADHLGTYGYFRPTSPHIDRFADESLVFEQARAQAPCTHPSVKSLLSARYPSRFASDLSMGIPAGFATLQKVLRERGWSTAAVSASPIVRTTPTEFNPTGGFGRDFDHFHEECAFGAADCVNGEVVRVLDTLGEPFFIYAHYLDPHNPYQPPTSHPRTLTRPYAGRDFVAAGDPTRIAEMLYREGPQLGLDDADWRHLTDLYDEEIRYFDAHFQVLLTDLAGRPSGRRTIVVLMSDHGEEFLEHGDVMHCRSLHDTQLRTPLILRVPGVAPRRVSTNVGNVDVVPTLLDYLGIDPAPYGFDGRSLRGTASGDEMPTSEAFGAWGRSRSVVEDGLKLIVDVRSGSTSLYDLSSDPEERVDLSGERPGDVARLRERLARHRDATRSVGRGAPADPEAIERQLRQLGYLE